MSEAALPAPRARARLRPDWPALAPFLALALLLVLGTALNARFIYLDNLLNMASRSAFIAVIGIGATFVIAAGGLDLSVGAMAAFLGGVMILLINAMHGADPLMVVLAGSAAAVTAGAACGLGNGLVATLGRIEPFIVTLGTMGIFRALITYLADGGSLTIGDRSLGALLRPVYFGAVADIPIPVLVFVVLAAVSALVLNRTPFGRHVVATGASEDVARYTGIPVGRVRTVTYVIQGVCVGIATVLYVPRLSSATPSTGLLWELQAITAVVIGGTPLRGGTGRIWGTIAGAIILTVVGNIMVLS
ncbi:MAG: ABC transporter permease, partial [Acetobacteraceae bacterium]|nr:ABC transporter permease [Acetobacteraceae bacterium]